MQNKRRRALAERVLKIADDYKKLSAGTRLLGRSKFEFDEIKKFKTKTEKYSLALTSAALKIAGGGISLSAAELRAERYLNRILDENYEVMIYDGEIGERLLEILGMDLM